jgi:hypothetical protein
MKLSLECRTDMLEMVQPFADLDWILAHKVLEDKKYAEFYRGSGNIKFVDNSVNEKGEPLPLESVKEAFEKVNGTYIVSPDFIGNAEKTIEAYLECLKTFTKEKVASVIQGPTFVDAFDCLKVYESGIICVPYDLCSNKEDPPWLMGLRRALFVSYIPRRQDIYVHLLGFNSLDELYWYQNNTSVGSIDTGIPVLLGLQGKDILDNLESKVKPTFNSMEGVELTQKSWTGIIRNIALLRKHMP